MGKRMSPGTVKMLLLKTSANQIRMLTCLKEGMVKVLVDQKGLE